MKKFLKQILSKPKIIIPMFAILGLVATALIFGHIGRAPIVPTSVVLSTKEPTIISGSNVSLSFPKSGLIETVSVNVGDFVRTGEVLARLKAPDALGAVNQAKGALDLAQAQYASMNLDYANTKKQQDLIVANAYQTLLSSNLEGVPSVQDTNVPIITGTYTCGKEGSYIIKPYASGDNDSGFSFNYSGIETGTAGIKYDNGVPMGNCGLQIKFAHFSNFNSSIVWTIAIPNTKSSVYLVNKNAYDLAVNNREKVLSDLSAKIGASGNESSVAKAQVDSAQGAYQAALGAYQNNLIISPADGVITFIDPDLKTGQSVTANKSVISISVK